MKQLAVFGRGDRLGLHEFTECIKIFVLAMNNILTNLCGCFHFIDSLTFELLKFDM